MIIIIFGLPGSGKSYFASRIAQMLNAKYISSDKLRKEMFTVLTYSVKEKLLVYNEMMRFMQQAINQNKDVVLDATFHETNTRRRFMEEAAKIARVFVIEIWADENIIIERLGNPRTYSDAGFDVHQKIKNEWEPFTGEHLVLQSTNSNITEMLEHAADYLFEKNDKRKHP